jgi:hypothetical protein
MTSARMSFFMIGSPIGFTVQIILFNETQVAMFLPFAFRFLLSASRFLPPASRLPPSAFCLPLTAHCPLLTAHCLLLTVLSLHAQVLSRLDPTNGRDAHARPFHRTRMEL